MPALTDELAKRWEADDSSLDIFAFLEQHACSTPTQVLPLILLDQGYRWQTTTPLRVEEYAEKLPGLADDDRFKLELAVNEFIVQHQQGSSPEVDDFLKRFADISEPLRTKLNSLAEQYLEGLPLDTSIGTFADKPQSIGQLDRYRLVRVLGKGAHGCVYLAVDESLGRRVAIKVPRRERFENAEESAQYRFEARAIAKLDHPNIAPIYDVGQTEDGTVYVV